MKCFKCEKVLPPVRDIEGQPEGGGEFVLTFHYGSEWDQEDFHRPRLPVDPAASRASNLTLCSHQIRGYVCDECFRVHSHLLDGWAVRTERVERKVL